MKRILLFKLCPLFIAFFLLFNFGVVYAQDLQTKWEERTNYFLDKTEGDKRAQLEHIVNANSMIEAISYTQNIVKKSVSSCTKAHPEMESDLKTAYTAFKTTLEDPIKRGRKRLKVMMRSQSFTSYVSIKDYIRLTNELAEIDKKHVELHPLTKLKGCQKFLKDISSQKQTDKIAKLLIEGLNLDQELSVKKKTTQ